MKISVHTDILIELAETLENTDENQQSIDALLSQSEHEYWVPALCVAKAHAEICHRVGSESGRRLLKFVQEHMASVPLRNATLTQSLQNNADDLEVASQQSVDSLVGVDVILSRTLKSSDVGGLACVEPEILLLQDETPHGNHNVPFLDLKAQFPKIYNEIDDRITDIMSHTGFVLGPHVEEFESAFAKIQNSKHCIGVSSGTDALHLAFLALGIGPGDEVVLPVNTFIATAEGVSLTGATPVFVDCDKYYNIDIDSTRQLLQERKSSNRVRAIVPVHLYGQPADLDGIRSLADEFGLAVVEDSAQAHLAEYRGRSIGNDGEFGVFSFYPGKNLGAYGEAGALVTNSDELYEAAKMRRAHGEARRYVHSAVGHNYRMEAIQGAVLATKLKYLKEWTEARQYNAGQYRMHLADVREVQLPEEPDFARSVYHLFVIQVDNRDALRDYLQENGIASGLHYPLPLHLQAAYKDLGYEEGAFPVAEEQAKRIVSLPMYPELSDFQVERVCDAVKRFVAHS